MNAVEANATAEKVARVWPKTANTIIDLLRTAFQRPEFDFEKTEAALNDLYFDNSEYFSFSDLRRKLGHDVKPKPEQQSDPMSLPNSPEAQSARRATEREQAKILDQRWAEAFAFVNAIDPKIIEVEKQNFLTTIEDAAKPIYVDLFKRATLPRTFVGWVFERETGKAVTLEEQPAA